MDNLGSAIARARAQRRLPAPVVRRQLRESLGLTQEDIAGAVGVTRSAVAYWELGRRTPQGETAAAYIAVLDRLATEAAQQGAGR